MDYNINIRFFLKKNNELLIFKNRILDYLISLERRVEKKEIRIPINKIKKIAEIKDFFENLTEIELLNEEKKEFPEEQDVYENEPIDFINNILKLNIFLVKKADSNFMLNVQIDIKDKLVSNILTKDFIKTIIKDNPIDFKKEFIGYFNEDFKMYFRLDKNEFLNEKLILRYGDDSIWIKISPFVFVKDFIEVRSKVYNDLFLN